MAVWVLDKHKKPLMPCSEKRARLLLERGRAVVHRLVPFVIRLKDRVAEASGLQPLRLTLDPGSKTTGMALVRETETVTPEAGEIRKERAVLSLLELFHRGQQIRKTLKQRSSYRRRRRGKNLRYRAPRFHNRRRVEGWLPPSLQHRVDTVLSWVSRLCRSAPVSAISLERVRFDTHKLQNPEIVGVEYQRGELFGYEVREYLLGKWGRQCAYCGAENVPLEIDHIRPRAKGGSDRVGNLTLACRPCNRHKGKDPVEDFLADQPERLAKILAQAKTPLRDAAVVNSTRWALHEALESIGPPVEVGSGGQTKWNRKRSGIPKTHALDAVCVGQVDAVRHWRVPILSIRCTGRGRYQRTRLTKHGFPRGYLMRRKQVRGFQTGDLVKVVVPKGKHAGIYLGRAAVRATGTFNIQTPQGVVQGIHARYCTLLQRADGYGYSVQPKIAPDRKEDAGTEQSSTAALSLPGLNAGVSRALR